MCCLVCVASENMAHSYDLVKEKRMQGELHPSVPFQTGWVSHSKLAGCSIPNICFLSSVLCDLPLLSWMDWIDENKMVETPPGSHYLCCFTQYISPSIEVSLLVISTTFLLISIIGQFTHVHFHGRPIDRVCKISRCQYFTIYCNYLKL